MNETKEISNTKATATYLTGKVKQLETLLPSHMDPQRFMRIVFLQLQKNSTLAKCSKESIYASMMSAAEVGLIPDGRQGALIPYKNRGTLEAQFQPQYFGLMDRARQSGEIADIYAASIRENDEFTYQLGFDRELIHRPNIRGNRGEIQAVETQTDHDIFITVVIEICCCHIVDVHSPSRMSGY